MPTLVIAIVLSAALLAAGIAYGRLWRRCRRAEAELEQARRTAMAHENALRQRQQLDGIKDEFISTVSHELRTPLTSIRGALGLLSAGVLGKVDEKAANLLRIASSNTDRLVRLINDILDLERMESGRAPMQLRSCELTDLLEHSAETMSSMAHASGVRVIVEDEPLGMPAAFDGDADRMQQVLVNLLSNAIKFSPAGSVVRVNRSFDADWLYIRVTDEGRGVPADKLDTIFDRFHQVESGDARQKGGTGLGLAICRSIVRQHNGDIWAERNDAAMPEARGTTLVIRLPRSPEAERAAVEQPQSSVGSILVVDDDPGVRVVVAEHLREQGYSVLEVGSGEQALQVAARQHVDAILLDLYMPGLTGWETIERLKSKAETASIPVVVLSVLSPTAKEADLVPDAQGWVQKPFNETSLLSELSRVLHAGAGPGRILLVEDDPEMADVVLSSFEQSKGKADVRVQHVVSVADAQHSCRVAPPDVMVLDLTLQNGNGFALVDWLRQQPDLRTLPLVVYSSREVSQKEREQLRLGRAQFMTKAGVQPADVEELVRSMVRQLDHSELEAAS